ncbi:MAG: sugar-transfer associated ATP-grasp domain-containing protein [Candidatus Dojkabacteria bacterium]
MFQSKKLKEILGLNRRNQEYVRPYNSPSAKAIADNKILTKKVLTAAGINTPSVYKLIKNLKQLKFLDWDSLPKSFVIKPNQGTGGNGIIVFYGKKKGENSWIRPNGSTMTQKDITLHIENILDGRFSMGDRSDIAIIEERVRTDPLLKQYSFKGVPDIRIICFNGVPIMAMTRLPTKKSNGTANLHSGAICTGLDISTGITTYSMQMNTNSFFSDTYEMIDYTTDLKENKKLSGIQIPNWDEILTIALKCQKASKLGYVGVDIAVDVEKGPVVFELNARPGLGIQVANQAGLRWRLEKIKDLEIKSIKHGIRVAKNLFGGEIEESIEAISGRKVVNITEKITLFYNSNNIADSKKAKVLEKENFTAFMDTGILTSRIRQSLASRIGFLDTLKYFGSLNIPDKFETLKEAQSYIDANNNSINEGNIKRIAKIIEDGVIKIRPVIEVKIEVSGEIKSIEMVITEEIEYPVVLGRNDLKGYLIDTSNTFS